MRLETHLLSDDTTSLLSTSTRRLRIISAWRVRPKHPPSRILMSDGPRIPGAQYCPLHPTHLLTFMGTYTIDMNL